MHKLKAFVDTSKIHVKPVHTNITVHEIKMVVPDDAPIA